MVSGWPVHVVATADGAHTGRCIGVHVIGTADLGDCC